MSVIELQNVCLDYIVKTGSDSIKRSILALSNSLLRRNRPTKIKLKNSAYRALNNVNLSLKTGDRVGILGRNGAGKSTLLRVMAKIYKPNMGTLTVSGNIASLFDVHLGINQEATGYENIINLAVARNLSKEQAHSIIEDVAEFTELGDFLSSPVRTYSSGMQMKLAFAVATALPPEIILIDEIIGVGDNYFMEKATKRMTDLIAHSHILVLTSHSIDIVQRFCNKVIVLDKGEVRYFGPIEEGITFYDRLLHSPKKTIKDVDEALRTDTSTA